MQTFPCTATTLGATLALLSSKKKVSLVSFFGANETLLNEINSFDLNSRKWISIEFSSAKSILPSSFKSSFVDPFFNPKVFYASCFYQDKCWFYSGYEFQDNLQVLTNELWLYDHSNHTIKCLANDPSIKRVVAPKAGATLTYIPSSNPKLVLFGGSIPFPDPENSFLVKLIFYNDVCVFDLSTHEWTRMNVKGRYPDPRDNHTSIYHEPTNSIIFYGGSCLKNDLTVTRFSDIFILNLDREEWIYPDVNGLVPALDRHSACLYDDKMIVYGGNYGPSFDDEIPSTPIVAEQQDLDEAIKIDMKSWITSDKIYEYDICIFN